MEVGVCGTWSLSNSLNDDTDLREWLPESSVIVVNVIVVVRPPSVIFILMVP